jgi:hypothetical protein
VNPLKGLLAVGATALTLGLAGTVVASPAGAATFNVTCTAGQPNNLQATLNSAPPQSDILVHGTCTGHFNIQVNDLTLGGPATLDGGVSEGHVLFVTEGVTVTLDDLTVQHGDSHDGAGIFVQAPAPGGTGATLALDHSRVMDNTGFVGAGIYNDYGTTTLDDSQVSNNTALGACCFLGFGGGGEGGGIFSHFGTTTITDSQVSSNNASYDGGGVYNLESTMILDNSQVSDNYAGQAENAFYVGGDGGGIFNAPAFIEVSTMTLNDSQVSNNMAIQGGGISNGSTMSINDSQVLNNEAQFGGGIFNGVPLNGEGTPGEQILDLRGSVVSGNTALNLRDPGGGIFNKGIVNLLLASSVVGNHPDNCFPSNSVAGCTG